VFVNYINHVGEMEPQGYVDEDLEPGIYQYDVTGVYDLEPYGFAGETGESMNEGPAEVIVDYCYDLEFIETWTMGSFENNEWLSDGANWKVNSQAGNPAPSVEFTWDPIQNDYAVALESYPLCAVGITEGKIWMDFDLAYYFVQPTGEEMLLAQVWNWETRVWTTVAEYSNSEGNLDWTTEHVDIRSQAMDKVFKIRFLATGFNSLDIRSWFIDNIHVYRTCDGPARLTSEPAFGEGILLSWQLLKNNNINAGIRDESGVRDLAGFSVYQSVDGGSYSLLPGFVTGNQYIIPEDDLIPGSVYCYKVSATWTSETDRCESDFSNETCAFWTSVASHPDPGQGSISIYPNPADKHAFITATDELERITIFDATGQLVLDQSAAGCQYEINASGFSTGIFMVRVETSAGIATRKLTVQR
jgi:hypothetical protein